MATLIFIPYDVVNLTHKQEINKIMFGDGYSQRQPSDINNARQRWSLNLPQKEGQTIKTMEAFFESNIGLSFLWTPPDDAARKFVCRSWNRTYNNYTKIQSLTATLEEVYE